MLHDLIFALQGYPGSIFKETSNGIVRVVPGLPFLSPSEESSLNRLLKLSTKIIFFQKFIDTHNSTLYAEGAEKHSDGLLHGCYLQALCYGLEDVLESYYQSVLDIEKEILADPLLTFMHVYHSLEHYYLLFDALYDLISIVKSRKSHGCQILSTVHHASQTGNRVVLRAMLRIQKRLHLVMYRQLSSWLLHGLLIDRHKEFFISKSEEKGPNDSVSVFQDTFSSSTLGSQLEIFYIRADMLPTYLPSRDADVILFIGSSLHLFEKDLHKQQALHVGGSSMAVALKGLSADVEGKRMDGILKENQQEFMRDFLWLQNQDRFSLEEFESRLNKIRSTVARELWDLCVVKAKLVSHFMMLKDYYLLGLGELYLVFLEESAIVMRKPPTKTTEHDVNQAFLRSAIKVQLEEDGALQNFKLVIESKSSKESEQSSGYTYDASGIMDSNDTWSLLSITFQVKWPLHIIFTPPVLSKYNKLFKFLLRVRRAQLALQNLWALQMQEKCSLICTDDDDASIKQNISNLTLRMHMSHLVDSLQYYLQADVLESHFSNLLSKIKNPTSTDFEQIVLAHDNYLTALLAQCFILSTPVFRSLLGVLDICQQFCEVVTASIQSGTISAQEVIQGRVEQLASDFERQSSLLFHTLSAVCNQQCNPHLAQFLLLLDFNKYYTRRL
ncbi:gamma-tubulin complex component 4-like [Styela clava]